MRIIPCEPIHEADARAVIREVHDEYGFTWDPHNYHRDLYDIQNVYIKPGGRFWVQLDGDHVVGCVGLTAHGDHCELHRMYLLSACRGRGWGRSLLEAALNHAKAEKFARMIAWSDVKLADAHRLYRAMGFTQQGERLCDDPDNSREYGFFIDLA